MSDEYTDYEPDGEDNHPALKKFNRPMAMIKHVVMKALKWAAIGAAVGAVALGLIAALPGGAAAAVGGILKLLPTWLGGGGGDILAEKGLGIIAQMGIKGLGFGAMAALPLGLIAGAIGAGDAADDLAMRSIDNYQNREDRIANKEMLELNRQQQMLAMQQQAAQYGLAPQPGLPGMGPGQRQI